MKKQTKCAPGSIFKNRKKETAMTNTDNFNEAFFYSIYPLGFCGALYANPNPGRHDFFTQNSPQNRLAAISDSWLDHICSLGANAVYFGPLFESTYHGYDTADYFWIDRRLGTNGDFARLVEKMHRRGIKVVVDGVFNHVGRNFWAFADVQKNGQNSPYKDWFYLDFSRNNHFNDGFCYCGWEGCLDLVQLNLQNPAVKQHLIDAALYWIENFKIDGIRFDVAYMIDRQFLAEISAACRRAKSDIWLLGEMIHGTYTEIANGAMLDSATNYECYKGLYSSLNDKNYFEIAYAFKRQSANGGIYQHLHLFNFADNHDVDRVASKISKKAHLFPLYLMLFTMPGIPSVYYGSEFGIEGVKTGAKDENVRPAIDLAQISANPPVAGLAENIKRFAQIRKNTPALVNGNYEELLVKNEQFAYKRQLGDKCAIAVFNLNDNFAEITVPAHGANGTLHDQLGGKNYTVQNGVLTLQVPPNWGMVLTN